MRLKEMIQSSEQGPIPISMIWSQALQGQTQGFLVSRASKLAGFRTAADRTDAVVS